ncbi:MAG: hypothetical protein N838_27445 [Thiohalocapsa sp. PB-PSB1]|nr:MAG: hypothetical protein N838_00590 [Thiohalocapsa sp. PB-PSB1]QQO51986.1 MAG: hypothetical protein N838_27445 [Thiohalocapsa sp. PB-PSB1]
MTDEAVHTEYQNFHIEPEKSRVKPAWQFSLHQPVFWFVFHIVFRIMPIAMIYMSVCMKGRLQPDAI